MVEETGDQLPVAQRAFGAAADNFGKEIAPVGKELGIVTAKVARLLISGLSKSVYGLETVGAWIEDKVSERLKGVPEDKIVEPNPRIAVPATQALIYSMDDVLIRDMFANLLAADMNADKRGHAHPAFVEMIREMAHADARVLGTFKVSAQVEFVARLCQNNKWNEVGYAHSFDVPEIGLAEIRTALSNLRRLELIESRFNEWPLLKDLDERRDNFKSQFVTLEKLIQANPEILKHMNFDGPPHLEILLYGLFPTPFGRNFINICLPA